MTPDVIGTIYKKTGTDADGEPVMEPIDGFHVNFPNDVPEIEDYKLDPQPDTPHRVYAGGRMPVAYRFPDEATFRQFFPVEEEEGA